MNENAAWYFGGGDLYDRRLRGQIEELEASVSGAYAQSSRLRSQLAQVQGDLGSKVSRLARAFDAFVELSDIRNELAVFTDAAIVRHQARQLLNSVAAGKTPVPPEPPSVPGYWLVPATLALHARLNGESAEASRQAEAAVELDGERARLFLAAATRLAGPVDLPAAELFAVLPAGPGQVPWGRRKLWLAAARGAFGPTGQELLTSALTRALTETLGPPPGPEEQPPASASGESGFEAWVGAVSHHRNDPAGVATALADLRARLAAIPDLTAAPAGTPTAGGADPGDEVLVGLSEVVRVLVDEGAPEERELVRRAVELRAVIENGTPPPPYQACDEPVGPVDQLVREDALADGKTPASVRGAAARVALPWLRAAVDRAVAAVPVTEPARTSTMRIWETDLTVSADGADPAALAGARSRIEAEYRPGRSREIAGAVLGGTGLVLAVLGAVLATTAGVLLLVLGVLLLVAGGITLLVGLRHNSTTRSQGADYLASIDRRIADEARKLRQTAERSESSRDEVDRERAALAEALAG